MAEKTNYFKELILISVGKRTDFSQPLTEEALMRLYKQASKQSLLGVLFPAIERSLSGGNYIKNPKIAYQWTAVSMRMRTLNDMQNRRAAELTEILADSGIRSCVLKGQGVAQLYPDPALRQCGDIDIWVEGDRKKIVKILRKHYSVHDIVYHHAELEAFPDAPVELHFHPTWLCNPRLNKHLQAYFDGAADAQFTNAGGLGFNVPQLDFQAVHSIAHIYRHLFDGGIGLRQIMDYYYILKALSADSRTKVFELMKSFRMDKFTAGLMYVMKSFFELDDEYLLCPPEQKRGKQILVQVIRGGNFGHYDKRNIAAAGESLIHRAFRKTSNILCYARYYPQEALWVPLWRVWHWFMKKHWN